MATPQASPEALASLRQSLAQADHMLHAGNPDAADRLLAPLLSLFTGDPRLLHLIGLIRMHQQRYQEAADFFARARAVNPGEAVLAFCLGTALRWLERHDEAASAFKDAIRLKPDYAEAYFETCAILQQLGDWPGAEALWRQALQQSVPQQIRALMHQSLGRTLLRQGKDIEALENYEKSASLNDDPTADAVRAEILQKLKRYDEAAELSRNLVARDLTNPNWHKLHNDLMYRLGDEDYLKSYDRAPKTAALLLSKGFFLSHQKRGEEALEAYRQALRLEPDNRVAAAGMASSLNMLKRHGEALTLLDAMLARGWLRRTAGSRALQLLPPGHAAWPASSAAAAEPR